MIDKTVILADMQLITEETNTDLLNLMINKAESNIRKYCNIDITSDLPDELQDTMEDLAIFKYRNINSENLKAESNKFSSSTYLDDIPLPIKRELNKYRVVVIH